MVYVADPEMIREIFQADPSQFQIPSQGVGGILTALVGNNSLLLLDGERHRRHRRLLMPPFHGEKIRVYSRIICSSTEQVMDGWALDRPFKVRQPMQEITLRVILKAVFGLQDGPRYEQLRQLLNRMLETLGTPLSGFFVFFDALQKDWGPLSPWGRFKRMKAQVDQLIYAEIRERKDQNKVAGDDLLRHWQFALVNRAPVQPVRRGLTIAPPGNLRLRPVKRNSLPAEAAVFAHTTIAPGNPQE